MSCVDGEECWQQASYTRARYRVRIVGVSVDGGVSVKGPDPPGGGLVETEATIGYPKQGIRKGESTKGPP